MADMKTFINPSRARMAIAGLALIGLFCSGYLLYTYVTGVPIACAIVHGCDVVRSSRWATSFGLPRPLFGVVFYVFILASLVIRAVSHRQANFWRTVIRGPAYGKEKWGWSRPMLFQARTVWPSLIARAAPLNS